MNSTGSGKSSTVSSVSELLDLYEEDPEEILLNLGFGRDEPDLSTKVPSRFLNSASSARGIDVKVYLGAQMQRLEVENPNYALTSRFRQLEVLTTVANEFFQLYSQVSGQSVQCINGKDQGNREEKKEGGKEASPPPLKKSKSALNAAKLLKKSITKHNLLAGNTESPASCPPLKQTQMNGEQKHTSVAANTVSEVEKTGGDAAHQSEPVTQKHLARKRDNSVLATVMEESAGVADDSQTTEYQVIKEEEKEGEGGNLTSTPEKAPFILAPPHLAQLRTENADSFDIEEIPGNEDDVLLPRSSRNSDLLRTVSQQSDSSGFAEEPSTDSSNLKVQESCESCDSETTVTSHPSQDLATPLALDKPAFELPESKEEGLGSNTAAEVEDSSAVKEEEEGHILCALNRARRNRSTRGRPQQSETPPCPSRGRGIPLQRSSSLPSSLSCPSRVVTSVRIQFGRGEASCSQPCYSIKNADGDESKKEGAEPHSNYLSTLVINSMSTGFHSVHGSPGVPGAASGAGMSSMEMQLRRVLYDIKGTVQGLNQVLAEFQQRRRSLCLFRNQMIDLELSLMRQQALVYKQLSPADRLDLEQLQLLRSAVREELQKLEQQLEERMMEFTQHTPNKGFHRDAASVDSQSTTSVLRATEPVSDLLREQLLLQSELSLNNFSPAAEHSSRSSSPAREGGEGVYRASINITPVAPLRPQSLLEPASEQAEESGNEEAGSAEGPMEMGAAANISGENLQQLIKEIRESVAKEVRQEIYHKLMAAVLPRQSS
ncbi:protein ITPRID2 [Neosynchiropus ocellatus]